jgi:hypothetical protein
MQALGVAMRREVSKESLVVSYIEGTAEVPRDLALLVQRYREYASVRANCVGFPKREDERANRIFDALVNSRG